jgi:hypothetical protein
LKLLPSPKQYLLTDWSLSVSFYIYLTTTEKTNFRVITESSNLSSCQEEEIEATATMITTTKVSTFLVKTLKLMNFSCCGKAAFHSKITFLLRLLHFE